MPKAMLNKSARLWAPWFGMGCKAQTTAIAQLWRGFATLQTAQNRDDRAERDLFSVALSCPAFLGLKRYARCNDWAQADISIEAFLDNL